MATVQFTPTMQPGDNFTVAASTNSNYLNGVTINGTVLNDSANRTLPTQNAKWTEGLTVWRRLHIEVDSMGPVTVNNIAGTFPTSQTVTGDLPTLQVNTNPVLEPNRYESGGLKIGNNFYEIYDNSANTVRIAGGRPFNIIAGQSFTMYDDDDFNSNDGVFDRPLHGDEGEDVSMLSQGFLLADSDSPTTNAFAPAYIVPKYDIGDDNNFVTFRLNVATDDAPGRRALFDFDQVATEASLDFWTIYLLSAYQYTEEFDEDPESEFFDSIVGIVDRELINGVRRGQGAIVFLETNGPKECPRLFWQPAPPPEYCNINATKIHEIGHLLGAEHNEGGVMDNLTTSFSADSLAAIRGRTYP